MGDVGLAGWFDPLHPGADGGLQSFMVIQGREPPRSSGSGGTRKRRSRSIFSRRNRAIRAEASPRLRHPRISRTRRTLLAAVRLQAVTNVSCYALPIQVCRKTVQSDALTNHCGNRQCACATAKELVDILREQRAKESRTGCPVAQTVPTPGTRRMGGTPRGLRKQNGNAQPRWVGR